MAHCFGGDQFEFPHLELQEILANANLAVAAWLPRMKITLWLNVRQINNDRTIYKEKDSQGAIMCTKPVIAHLLFAISIFTSAAYAADHIRVVAMTGQQAPGFPTGVTFQITSNSIATINASGELTFTANLGGVGIDQFNNNSVWVGTPENLQLLAQEGQPAPGTEPDTVFDAFTPIADGFESPIAPNGEVAFWARVRGPSVTFGINSSGIWAGTPGNLQLVAREGDPAPGTEAGTVFNSIDHRYAYNDGGAVFYATLSGPSVDGSNDHGIWAGRAGNVQLVVREGGAAPDLPPGC